MSCSTVPFVTWIFVWLFQLCNPTTDLTPNCSMIWGLMLGNVYAVACVIFSIKLPDNILGSVAFNGWDCAIVIGIVVVSMLILIWGTSACFDLSATNNGGTTGRVYLTIMLMLFGGLTVLMCYAWVPLHCYRMGVTFPKMDQCYYFT